MIERDGSCISLWQQTSQPYRQTNAAQNNYFDVAIAGGGITGITTALLLQQTGKKCIVFEAHNLCYGTTGGTTAHLNTLLDNPYSVIIKKFGEDNAKLVANATKDAIASIKENISQYKIDCEFEDASAYLFAQTEDQEKELKDIHDACRTVGVKAVYSDTLPVDISFKKAIIVDGQAKFHPVKYVQALAKAFEDAGGIIMQNCMVQGLEKHTVINIATTHGDFKADRFIYATHIPPGINLLHLRCVPYRSYAIALTLKNKNYPADLIYDMYDPYHYIRTQKIDGKDYLIVGAEDHKTGKVQNTNECFSKLESYIKAHFDVDEIITKWSSQYFEPSDTLPYIGHLPGADENIFVATGYGGNGMTYSHVAAITLRDIITNTENPYIKLFDPTRVKPVAGFTTFVSHNADVVKAFAEKLFPKEKLEALADLQFDEGKVVKYDDKTIALYKDKNGKLFAVNPSCTHMQCNVAWNKAEQSWDCPCHGSRFNINGEILTGPATIDLENINVSD
jgi:glycine/D-amino acid oxidase-like deaminating enzyme/nitrite reductase/ring-hydroxylating ferredoxin subunit